MRIKKIKNLLKLKNYFLLVFLSSLFYIILSAILVYYFFNGFYLFFNYSLGYYPWINIIFALILSVLFGLNIGLLIYRFNEVKKYTNESGTGIFTSILGIFSAGCPICSLTIIGFIVPGLSAAYSLAILPFKGLEIQLFGILVLIISILILTKDEACETLLK